MDGVWTPSPPLQVSCSLSIDANLNEYNEAARSAGNGGNIAHSPFWSYLYGLQRPHEDLRLCHTLSHKPPMLSFDHWELGLWISQDRADSKHQWRSVCILEKSSKIFWHPEAPPQSWESLNKECLKSLENSFHLFSEITAFIFSTGSWILAC